MKAIRVHEFGGPDVLRFEEIDDPQPGAYEILVGIKAIGVNPVETYIRSGTYGRLPELPYTPGTDAAGRVLASGEGVENFSVGDRVYTSGSLTGVYAEKAICRLDQVHHLPEKISYEQGAALGVPYGAAYRALFHRGKVKPGESVLVHGATGGVGQAAVQFCRALGAKVFATGGSEEGLDLARVGGAHHAVNHHNPNHLEEVKRLNNGIGLDLIIEMLANVNLNHDLEALNPGGRVVVVGNRGTVEINPRDLMSRDASIHGILLFNATADELRETHCAIRAGLHSGVLRPYVGKHFSLHAASEAHREVIEGKSFGKIVMLP